MVINTPLLWLQIVRRSYNQGHKLVRMGVSQPIPVIGSNIRVAIDMDGPIVHAIEVPIPDIIGVLVPGSVVPSCFAIREYPSDLYLSSDRYFYLLPHEPVVPL